MAQDQYTWFKIQDSSARDCRMGLKLFYIVLLAVSGCTNIVDPSPVDCLGSTLGITVEASTPTSGCNTADGTIQLHGEGGDGGYLYRVDGVAFQSSGLIEGLRAGFYNIDVIDAIGCSASATYSIASGAGLSISEIVIEDSDCDTQNGSITVIAVGGVNIKYRLGSEQFCSSNIFSDLAAGVHEITVTDNSNCEVSATVKVKSRIPFTLIRAILEVNCTIAGCHDGSSRRVDLTISTNVASYSQEIKSRTGKKTMPLRSSRLKLTDDQIQKITCWVDNGADINN